MNRFRFKFRIIIVTCTNVQWRSLFCMLSQQIIKCYAYVQSSKMDRAMIKIQFAEYSSQHCSPVHHTNQTTCHWLHLHFIMPAINSQHNLWIIYRSSFFSLFPSGMVLPLKAWLNAMWINCFQVKLRRLRCTCYIL